MIRRALAVLLLFVLLTPLAQGQVEEGVAQPIPMEGAEWTFDTTLGGEEPVEAPTTLTFEGIEPVEVGDESFDAYRFVTRYGGTREGESSTTWYRVSDFAKLRVAFTQPEGEAVFTLDEPCREWRFPMEVGDTWTTECKFMIGSDAFTIPSTWTVEGAERVTVPAGTYDAVVLVQEGEGFAERWWFAPQACWWVRHESLDAEGRVQASDALTSFNGCTPASTTPSSPTPASPTTPTEPTPAAPTGPAPTTPPGSTSGIPDARPTPGDEANASSPNGEGAATPGPAVALVLAVLCGLAVLRRGRRS